MLNNNEIKDLVRLSWSEYRCGFHMSKDVYYSKDSSELKKLQQQCEVEGIIIKSYDSDLKVVECGLMDPFQGKKNVNQEEDQMSNDGIKVRESLWRKVKDSIPYTIKEEGSWMFADARIQQISISSDAKEIKIEMEGVVEYSDSIRFLKVHMLLKQVKQYQIIKFENGTIITDDQDKRMSFHYNMAEATIQNDYYEIYQNGYFTLIVLIPDVRGWFIQVDFKNKEIKKEVIPEVDDGMVFY